MNIPTHVAIILDGNRRWAKIRNLPSFEGHRKGLKAVVDIGRKARKMGIKILTVWAFSTENWGRSAQEIKYLMKLYKQSVEQNLKEALKEQIRIIHLGRKDRIPKSLREKIILAEKKTQKFTKYYFCIALDYGGRDEILRAFKRVKAQKSRAISLVEEKFNQYLDTRDLPQSDIDLVIRTGGEVRTSGFMIWQAAYAEWIFVRKYLPDFTPADFEECIKEYCKRQRRFGR